MLIMRYFGYELKFNEYFSLLQTELHHYEKRLLKLRNLHLEVAVSKYSQEKKIAGEKVDDKLKDLEKLIKKQSRKVEKLHADIESRILPKTEL